MIKATYEKAEGREWRFYCGTQFADWSERFCVQCEYGWARIDPNPNPSECEVDERLTESLFDDSLPVPDQLEDSGGEHGTYNCLMFEKARAK